jgi:FkbM family methyltransferase
VSAVIRGIDLEESASQEVDAMTLKSWLRDLIPMQYQVPVKYHYNRCASMLEPEMKLVEQFVKENRRAIDVGGNRGVYTYRFWKLGAKVEVFEPNSNCSRVLSAWAKTKTDVSVHPVALSNYDGAASLVVPVDEAGVEHDASGTIEFRDSARAREQNVLVRTLDSFEFDDVTFIKIDVEGHEYDVLEGATATIRSMKPAILIEIEQRHISRPIQDVFNRVSGFGYSGSFLKAGQLVSLAEFNVATDQDIKNLGRTSGRYISNFLFLPD